MFALFVATVFGKQEDYFLCKSKDLLIESDEPRSENQALTSTVDQEDPLKSIIDTALGHKVRLVGDSVIRGTV